MMTKTVQRYVRRGILHPICRSSRSVKYDLNEVEKLATCGVSQDEAEKGENV
jgi:predicted site-specific integrase-resolvase